MKSSSVKLPHILSFCDVSKYGSLQKASARSGVSEATLSRHIKSLEHELGLSLFRRSANKLILTRDGADLKEFAGSILDAAQRFEFEASCRRQEPDDLVRIAVPQGFSFSAFPSLLYICREVYPNIATEIVATNDNLDLLSGEVDLVFNTFCPLENGVQSALIYEHLVGAFASADYVRRYGSPKSIEDLSKHIVIGDLHGDDILRCFDTLGYRFDKSLFKIRCDNRALAWRFVLSGLGIGFCDMDIGVSVQGVQRVLEAFPPVRKLIWVSARASLSQDSSAGQIYNLLSQSTSGIGQVEEIASVQSARNVL